MKKDHIYVTALCFQSKIYMNSNGATTPKIKSRAIISIFLYKNSLAQNSTDIRKRGQIKSYDLLGQGYEQNVQCLSAVI